MIIVADTSAVLAAFDEGQPQHDAAAHIMETETLLLSPLVLTELDHLARRENGFPFAIEVSEALLARLERGMYQIAAIRYEDLETAHRLRLDYAGLELDLADTVGVALAGRYGTNRIFTLDQRDFRALKPLSAGFDAFEILPFDWDAGDHAPRTRSR
ncbi:PIN domain-containing protein [Glycomyces sp. L485]|uniref:type II toxin-antitoxin system VapC family toxin n=1 Tax=Glycomyces sp. L485 TaxID=2909235 RepID=UPI001F4B1040|nr:PIN domain-containing protein [Glycomyces sp. L485]MCH7230421.1 PIN domain-containing protein [Glycomyces sp. L485]